MLGEFCIFIGSTLGGVLFGVALYHLWIDHKKAQAVQETQRQRLVALVDRVELLVQANNALHQKVDVLCEEGLSGVQRVGSPGPRGLKGGE